MAMISQELRKSLNQLAFPQEQYYREIHTKKQIYLHHTASGRGYKGDFRHFLNDPIRVATFCIIDDDKIHQLFNSKYWGHHLGIKTYIFKERNLPNINRYLNKISIGIEIDAWGQLIKLGNDFYNYFGGRVKSAEVCILDDPYKVYSGNKNDSNYFYKKGFSGKPCIYYHKYSEKQLYFLNLLLPYLAEKYCIDITYNKDIWDLTDRALKGEEGLFTHNSVRPDKTDVFPQPELIKLLKSL